MTTRIRVALSAALVAALAWLPPPSAHSAEIVVSAASSLADALEALRPAFFARHPQDAVVFNLAASDVLLAQIDRGAPVDVFASADEATMDRADRAHRLAPGTRRIVATNRLVIVVPKGAAAVGSVDALLDATVRRVAVGSPATVPAGRYARGVLEASGAWQALQPKLVLAQNVRQVLDYVARGEVDAGFVYATDAALMPDRVVVTADAPGVVPIRYSIAVVADSRHKALAAAFVDLVDGPEGRAALGRLGFGRP